MHSFKTLNDILSHQITLKQARGKVDLSGIESLEKPREVYLRICSIVAAHFVEYGFRFLKSGVSLVKEAEKGDLKLTIRFQSDYDNIAVVYIGLSVGFYIESVALKKWQKKYGIPGQVSTGDIFGGDFSMFSQSGSVHFLWNLADKNEREIAVIEIIDLIESKVIPVFDFFGDTEGISQSIIDGDFILRNPLANIQYLLLNKSETEVCEAIKNYINSSEKLKAKYKDDNTKIIEFGLPAKMYSYKHDIACFAHYYKLSEQISF